MNKRIEKQPYKLTTLAELQFVKIDYGGDFILDKPPRQERRLARIGWQLPACTDQQHVYGLTQAGKFSLIVEHNCLDASAFGYETEQPRFAAARIRPDEKAGVDQNWQVTFEPYVPVNLSDDHRPVRGN
jgi:hypothetical protein